MREEESTDRGRPTGEEIASLLPPDGLGFTEALHRVLESPRTDQIIASLFPSLDEKEFSALARSCASANELQARVIYIALKSLIKRTSKGFSHSGTELVPRSCKHLYLSNHRDIAFDPAVVTLGTFLSELGTPKICLGDNLLVDPWSTDLIKINKGITVKRGVSARELLRWSRALSSVLHAEIGGGRDSVWLAQREGRAKDGDDRTQPGLIKMLALEGEGDFIDRLQSLHIIPVAISYELDPCDVMKALELWQVKQRGSYEKAPGEDLRSMGAGILGQKGRIHVSFGAPIDPWLEEARREPSRGAAVDALVRRLDSAIHSLFRLFPSHYVAADTLAGNARHSSHYTAEESLAFTDRLVQQLEPVPPTAREGVRRLVLEAYARPVLNRSVSL